MVEGVGRRDFNRPPGIISRNNLRVTTRAAMNNNQIVKNLHNETEVL